MTCQVRIDKRTHEGLARMKEEREVRREERAQSQDRERKRET